METKLETSSATNTNKLSLRELDIQHRKFILECGFSKARAKNRITATHNFDDLNTIYEEIIAEVNGQIKINQARLNDIEAYGEDGIELNGRVSREIERQNKYIDELKSQQSETKLLKFLFSLPPKELVEEAIKNKPSALLIVKTPELIEKIPNNQLSLITHQDSVLLKLVAPILLAREYTTETPQIYEAIKQNFQTQTDVQFIEEQENAATRMLLIKMKAYLDKKIDQAAKGNTHPWALGYFGSRHKLSKNDKNVSVPHGIYDIKTELDQIDKKSPKEILTNIQSTLHHKLEEMKDESLLQQFKRWISYLFGYHRTQETVDEYQHLEGISLGMKAG